jgi:hypothetical protein
MVDKKESAFSNFPVINPTTSMLTGFDLSQSATSNYNATFQQILDFVTLGLALGTMAYQNDTAVDINGGTMNGVEINGSSLDSSPIGASSRRYGGFTQVNTDYLTFISPSNAGITLNNLTTTEKNALANQDPGMLIFNVTTNRFEARDNVDFSNQLAYLSDVTGAIAGLGTMAYQDDTAVDINGGSIDGTAIGNSAPNSGSFTLLTAGSLDFNDVNKLGLTLNNLTTAQAGLSTPVEGSLYANTDSNRPIYYDGTDLQEVAYVSDVADLQNSLGTMAFQDDTAVDINGGDMSLVNINGSSIGGVAKSYGGFTNIECNTIQFISVANAGLTFNNLNTTQKNTLGSQFSGMAVFNSQTNRFEVRDNSNFDNQLAYLTDINNISAFSTVGTGGDYATYYDAWSAGKRLTIQISNVTETQSYVFPATTVVYMLSKGQFSTTFGIHQIECTGILYFRAENIQLSFSAPVNACFYAASGSSIEMKGGSLTCSSTTKPYFLNNNQFGTPFFASIFKLINSTLYLNNTTAAFINLYSLLIEGGTINMAGGPNLVDGAKEVRMNPESIIGNSSSGVNNFISAAYIEIDISNCSVTMNNPAIDALTINSNNALIGNSYIDVKNLVAPSTVFQILPKANSILNVQNLYTPTYVGVSDGSRTNITNSYFNNLIDNTTPGGTVAYVEINNSYLLGSSNNVLLKQPNIYRITNTDINATTTTVQSNDTLISNLSCKDLLLNNSVSNVKISSVTAVGSITVSGTGNIVDNFSCDTATFNNNARFCSFNNAVNLTNRVVVSSGCFNCVVLNTTAANTMTDAGTATRKTLNYP